MDLISKKYSFDNSHCKMKDLPKSIKKKLVLQKLESALERAKKFQELKKQKLNLANSKEKEEKS